MNTRLVQVERIIWQPNTVRVVYLQRQSNLLICSVTQGAVDIWLGDYSSGLPAAPDLHFGQTNKPEWVPLPCGLRELTIKASGAVNPNLACVIIGGPPDA